MNTHQDDRFKCGGCKVNLPAGHYDSKRCGTRKKWCRQCLVKKVEYNAGRREQQKAQAKLYRENHKEEIKAHTKLYYENHKEETKAQKKLYYEQKWWVSIIHNSKQTDIKKNLFIEEDFIDKEFVLDKFEEQNNRCHYCHIQLNTVGQAEEGKRDHQKCTIERIDNTLGHSKENCVLACFRCNNQRSNRYTSDVFFAIKATERVLNADIV